MLEVIMILKLLSLIMFTGSAILFGLMTWDMLDYGRYYWGYLQFALWFAMGICTIAYALCIITLRR
tara:strand:+ start:442 stop:639 length:198 start_codon:yes stop_codon:yes gene_type:complete